MKLSELQETLRLYGEKLGDVDLRIVAMKREKDEILLPDTLRIGTTFEDDTRKKVKYVTLWI